MAGHGGHGGGGGMHHGHGGGHGFMEALGFSILMRHELFRLFVLGVVLIAILKG